jgi:hypothetical protein
LSSQKRYEEAEPLLLESYNSLKEHLGASDPGTGETLRRLVVLYEAWGKPAQAAKNRNPV